MKIKKAGNKLSLPISIFLGTIMFFSCTTPKNITYFQDTTQDVISLPSTGDLKIEPNDKFNITVKALDPAVSALFNLSITSDRVDDSSNIGKGAGTMRAVRSTNNVGMARYTVSPKGYIDFPVLGEIKVAGMTRDELCGFIKGELIGKDLAKDPIVTIEFVNMGVSLMGEVRNPGLYDITQDRVSLLEALSMAGDLTELGQRENVAVLREKDGKVNTYRVDLTNFKELAESPVYYLKQGDIVYVEPNDMKKRQSTTNGNNVYTTGFWISVASLLTSITTTVGVFVLR